MKKLGLSETSGRLVSMLFILLSVCEDFVMKKEQKIKHFVF